MASADDDRHNWVSEDAIARRGDRLLDEPVSWKAAAIPRKARAEIGDHLGIARGCEPPFFDLYEVAGELIQPVRIVTQQIGLDEHVCHCPRAIARHPCWLEESRREDHQLVGAVPNRQRS